MRPEISRTDVVTSWRSVVRKRVAERHRARHDQSSESERALSDPVDVFVSAVYFAGPGSVARGSQNEVDPAEGPA